MECAKRVVAALRRDLDRIELLLADLPNRVDEIERVADSIAEGGARLGDEVSPQRGKPRTARVRKALGYTYP